MNGWLIFFAWFGARADGGRSYSETPQTHWVTEGLELARQDGLLITYPDCQMGARRPPSRYEITVALAATMSQYRERAIAMTRERTWLEALAPTDERLLAYNAEFQALKGMRSYFPFFRRAQLEFLPQMLELRSMAPFAGEVEGASNRVLALGPAVSGERSQPFRDMPTGHWAAKAVGELRALGLIEGYPDKRFGG